MTWGQAAGSGGVWSLNSDDRADEELRRLLDAIRVRAWRLHLDTLNERATVPLLRGAWGRTLREESLALYASIFEGDDDSPPRYLMRPAPASARPAPALDFLLFGRITSGELALVRAAWARAAGYGLGPGRQPFRIRRVTPLAWDGTPLQPGWPQPGFTLGGLAWPGGLSHDPCALSFPAPLRLLRRGRLIRQPVLADVVVAALRRFQALGKGGAELSNECREVWLQRARLVQCAPWVGQRLDLVRYSGSQRREIELQGVAGVLELPRGPGPLAELLAAARWTHLGKGAVMGLGALEVIGVGPAEEPGASREPRSRSR